MTLVLLILAVIWAAVLIPPALRARAEGRPADSITAFHRQLSVLRRTGPRTGRGDNHDGEDTYGQGHVAPVRLAAAYGTQVGGRQAHAVAARRQARRRRRDVLNGLLATAAVTLALGAIPALRMLWVIHVVVDVLLIGFVALLIRQRNLATERDLKVRLLPTARRQSYDRSGWTGAEPALLRRSAN
ncbi:MAG: hypothetical protein ACRD12_10835 [Acidimicrobiales bacterium]